MNPTRRRAKEALVAHSDEVFETVLDLMAHLGARVEWSMEDNFSTTEEIARLATRIGLPSAGDQSQEDLEFWGQIDGYQDATIGFPGGW